jgi:proteasome lid subunit RPN8/RPN11
MVACARDKLMISRVLLPKALLTSFRKLAEGAYPNEVMQTMWGRIEGESVMISSLKSVAQQANPDMVVARVDDMVSPASHTREHFLGSIHSHPDVEHASPSTADWDGSYACGEHVFAVMALTRKPSGKFHVETRYWEVHPPIQIIHPRTRKARPVAHRTPEEPSQGL